MSAVQDFDGLPTAAEWQRADRAREDIERSLCTHCGAQPGDHCRTPKGSTMRVPHATRRDAAITDDNWAPA